MRQDMRGYRSIYYGIILLGFFFISLPAAGQFYYGHQMTFGKNRVQFNSFYWSFYRFEQFDIYFNEYGRELTEYTAEIAQKKLFEIEDYFDYTLNKRLIFLVYNKQSDYRQSNIGNVEGIEETNVGGIKRVIDNKVFLFYPGDHVKYNEEISAAITQVLINEMINGGDMRDNVSSSSQIDLPDWFTKGLVSFISRSWDLELENRVKDGILNKRYKKLNQLEREDAVWAGHSFWRYIARQYGDAVIPNILYLTRINKNLEKGFFYVLGKKIKELSDEWIKYYRDQYASNEKEEGRETLSGIQILKKTKPQRVYQQIRISPDGYHIAYVTNELGRYKVWIYNTQTKKKKKIYAKEPKVEQIIDYSYPVLGWYPNGNMLAFIAEEKGGLVMHFYRMQSEKTEKINLLYFEKILDFDFSDDGSKIVFSAVKNGHTDLFVYDVASGTNEQLTDDMEDDLHPRFINQSKQILFSSNRSSDTLGTGMMTGLSMSSIHDLFIYNYHSRSNVLRRLSEGKYWDKNYPYQTDKQNFLYLGDQNGIINRYAARFDSGIAYVDTAIHYRYYTVSTPLTNYNRNILEQDYSPESGVAGDIVFSDDRYIPEYDRPDIKGKSSGNKLISTAYREIMNRQYYARDSLEQLRQRLIEEDRRRKDTLTRPLYSYFKDKNLININHYIFEQEKRNYYNHLLLGKYANINLDTAKMRFPAIRIYETSFYRDYTASQFDFGFLNNSYQYFNGNGVYYNPGLNGLFKIGAKDLFEDYKITAGFRFSGDLSSNEYLISFENLIKRIDKQIIFYRQVYKAQNDQTNSYEKVTSQQLFYSLKYPFNQVMALKGTASMRTDRMVPLSTDNKNLHEKNIFLTWANMKLEYIFDDTRSRGINIYFGTRFKIFGEAYYQLERKNSDVFILGADIRHYQRIHRDLIWATRLAGSTSFGHNKLIYYLGGVDNSLLNMFNPDKAFNKTIPVDYSQHYVFQTVATDMRGFKQNIRNGNNFILLNTDIRWPVFRYFANHPLGSRFLNNFQIVGFGDLGTAWTGINPYAGQNSYDKRVIRNGPLTVTVETNREPFVAGVGLGVRALIFGYFIRADIAWGIENYVIQPRMFHLSFSTDF